MTLNIALGVVLAILFIIWIAMFLRRRLREVRAARLGEANAAVDGQTIRFRHDGANFFGLESLGVRQIRGNGVLTVTDAGVHFLMWVPRREFWVPAEAITGTAIVRSHLTKTVSRDLVRLDYTSPEGEPDSGAWLTDPLDEARAALEAIAPKG